MSNPATRGQRPVYTTMPLPGQPSATTPGPGASQKLRRPWPAGLKGVLVTGLLTGGMLLYRYYEPVSGTFGEPLGGSFRLSGNFGELRSQHFHMGLDVRTNGQENLPVYTVADGYVSRVLIEEYGLGKAVFITHPNGYTTVYAHLNTFYPALQAAVAAKQQATQKREQDLSLSPGQFPVSRGQLIAWSGNTGGSEAPHLHFELRDTRTGHNLNPLVHGFDMDDDQPPVIKGLYWYNRQHSTYRLAGNTISIQGEKGTYKAARPVIKVRSPLVSLGIKAEDKSDDKRFLYGIYRVECRLDGTLVHEARMDDFSYTDSRYINACIDYPRWMQTGGFVRHLSRLPGNHLAAWRGEGLLDLSDGRVHRVAIKLYDANNNSTTFDNDIQYSGAVETPSPVAPGSQVLVPGRENKVTGKYCRLQLPAGALYDTVYFALQEQPNKGKGKASPLIRLYKASIPLHEPCKVSVKAFDNITDRSKKRTVMQLNNGRNKITAKGAWQGNWCTAAFNTLGSVQLLVDTLPPTIEWVNGQQGQTIEEDNAPLKLLCRDETDGVAQFRAELDGAWTLYERKGSEFLVPIPAGCKPGRHTLAVHVTDVAGNSATQTFFFEK